MNPRLLAMMAVAMMPSFAAPAIEAASRARRKRELEEAARHPATQRKPQSESLKRLLGKSRSRP